MTPAGKPKLRETLTELKEVVRQIASESVQQHPKLVEVLRARESELCLTLVQIADKGAPRLFPSFGHLSAFAESRTTGCA